jgi:5S rRNA maturation endonuclease (ribonuclease M5)
MNAQEYVELREGRDGKARRIQGGWQVTCPAHDDRTPSLSVSEGRDGRVLLHCHAGCQLGEILAADGLEVAELYPESERIEVATYRYLDEQSRPLFEVVRFHPKDFRQRRPSGAWGIVGVRRVLYRLPHVLAAIQAGETVHVVEGEKDVHAVERAGGVATCNPMGAGKWSPEYTESLRDATVVVVADGDEEGRKHAQAVVRSLEGAAASIRAVEAAVGKDVHDHLAAGKTLAELVPFGSAHDAAAGEPSAGREVLRVLPVDWMLTTIPPPVPWVVEPLLARGCVTMLAGREGRGKSMLALALAAALGRATLLLDVAGMTVGVSGHVLYVDAENGPNEVHRRVHGLNVAAGMLTYVEADGFDLRRDLELLDRLVRQYQPKVLVLDSLRSLAPGLDENDSQQCESALRPVVRLTHELGLAALVLHHASRASGEYRGSTAIGAAVELGFTLTRYDEDPMAATRRKLACWKSRPAAEPAARWLTIKPTDDGEILLSEAAAYEPERSHPVQNAIEEALRTLVEEACGGCGGPIGDHKTTTPLESSAGAGDSPCGDNTTRPQAPSWTGADFARHVGPEPADWSVRQVVKRLAESGLIHRNGDERWYPGPTPDGEEVGP